MFRAAPPLERTANKDRPSGLTFRDKVLGLFKQRQQSSPSSSRTSSQSANNGSKPFAFRLKRGSLPVRTRSRRGLSRFIPKSQSTRKELAKSKEDVRASLRFIEDIYHSNAEDIESIYNIQEESESVSSEHTEPRDNRTNSRLNLGLSRSDVTRGWNGTSDTSKKMEIIHVSIPVRTTRTSPRSPMVRSTSSIGQFRPSRHESTLHLHDSSSLIESKVLTVNSTFQPNVPSRVQSRRSTIDRTESPSSDKDSLKPPRFHSKPAHSEDRSKDHSPPSDPSPKDMVPPKYPLAMAHGSSSPRNDPSPKDVTQPVYPMMTMSLGLSMAGRPASRRITPEVLKPRFREFPMKYPSQPMLSVPERETLPRLSPAAAPAAPEPTPYLPGFSEGDYVDDERLERILKLIQMQKTEMESKDTRSSSSTTASSAVSPKSQCAFMPPRNSKTQGSNDCQPGFDAEDYVDDDQLDIVLQNLQDGDLCMMKKPCSFQEGKVSCLPGHSRHYPTYHHHHQVKVVPNLHTKQGVVSPLRLTFCKHESIPTIRREVPRTYSLPSMTSIVRV